MRYREIVFEASPNTVEGSFTPDLIESKKWLVRELENILQQDSAGDIFVLGSWYGNLAIIVEQSKIKYDQLVLVEKEKHLLSTSKKLLKPLDQKNKLQPVLSRAEELEYPNKKITVINTSVNEMNRGWYDRIPKNTLVVIQGRNNLKSPITKTNKIFTIRKLFPLQLKYENQQNFKDPETEYTRFMLIGYK